MTYEYIFHPGGFYIEYALGQRMGVCAISFDLCNCCGYIVYYGGLAVLAGFHALLTQWFRG